MKFLFSILAVLVSHSVSADQVDLALRLAIKKYNIHPIEKFPKNPNRYEVELGRLLFSEKMLSGNRNMSCMTCHNPATGTSDNLPLSRTEDGLGILARNAPGLFNVGSGNKKFMYWDGRVSYEAKSKIFNTPEAAINGANPKNPEIAHSLNSALAAQAIFPLVSAREMMGAPGTNEIANAENNIEAWDRIIERLKKDEAYLQLFFKAYPTLTEDKINIAHVGEAIAAFQTEEFESTDSPFQRYLRGNKNAMTLAQKRGALVFMEHGKCIGCHQGSELGKNDLFASVATPQWGAEPFILDKGQGDILKDSRRDFFYKVPGLVNIKLTAPYMHNGAYQTLSEVIDHYDHVSENLNGFKISSERQSQIPVKVSVANQPLVLDQIWLSSQSGLFPELKNKLRLLNKEKKYLEIFLKEALTDPVWEARLSK